MADHHVDEPPNKRAKMIRDPFQGPSDSSAVISRYNTHPVTMAPVMLPKYGETKNLQQGDGFSNLDMFDLEKDLPDELMGGSWGEQPGITGPKPPAQGPGPGGQLGPQQLNGDDPAAAMQRQINNHLLQQSNKGGLVGHNNQLAMGSLGSKSPNLQSPPNVSVSKDLMGAMHQHIMPNTSHPNQLHTSMPMSSIQGGMVTNVGGNMIVTNSGMGGGMLGGGILNSKQLPALMANNHHAVPAHHPHAQNIRFQMQNGPLAGRVGVGVMQGGMRGPHHQPRMQAPAGGHPGLPYHPPYGQSPQGPAGQGVGAVRAAGGGGPGGGGGPAGAAAGLRFGPAGGGGGGGEAGGAQQAAPPQPSPQTPGAPAGGQSQPQAATQANPAAPPQQPATGSIADPEKRKLIQQQLVLLLHAHKCQRRESQGQSNGETGHCQLPHCKTMKGVLNHMMSCQAGKNCSVPHCSSSRQIINHWKYCNKSDCPVCLPLKQADRTNKTNNMNGAPVSQSPGAMAPGPGGPGGMPQGMGPGPGLGGPGLGLGVGGPNSMVGPAGNQLNVVPPSPSPSVPSTGADMKRAYEALGIACPSSVSGLGAGGGAGAGGAGAGGGFRGAPRLPQPPQGMQQVFPQPTDQMHTLMGGSTLQLPGGTVTANPVSGTKEWHQSITADLRNHLVHKLVQAIFPSPDSTAMLDKRMYNLVAYARKVEGDMYEMASTRSEYYHLLAEKIYKIQKELEEKRQKRKEQQQQIQAAAAAQQQQQQSHQQLQGVLARAPAQPPPPPRARYPAAASPFHQLLPSPAPQQAPGYPPSMHNGPVPSPSPDCSKPRLPAPQQQQQPGQASPFLNHAAGYLSAASLPQPSPSPGLPGSVGTPATPLAMPSPAPASAPSSSHQLQQQQPPPAPSPQQPGSVGAPPAPDPAPPPPHPPHPPPHPPPHHHAKQEPLEPDIKEEPSEEAEAESDAGGKGMRDEPHEPMDQNEFVVKPDIKHELKQDMKDEPATPGGSGGGGEITDHGTKRTIAFKPEELRQALMPTLEKLFRQDPESFPFRQPVDAGALGIPDYFDIVARPIDLSTIKGKLDQGEYKDPWEYVDDVWLMFDNAWLYNRKNSRVYRYCTKLSEVFEAEIDPVMQSLGYCCGRKYTFNPQVLCCYGKQLCTIPRDAKYFSYQNRYTFCQKCFNDIQGDTVTLGDDPLQSQTAIKKDQFKEMKNDHLEQEPFVICSDCGRKQHQICILHHDSIWPQGFCCDNCLKKKGAKRKENKFSAKRLPPSRLGIYIETRVNNFLKKKEAGAGEVHIRVVASSDKIVEVKPGMRSRFVESGELHSEFPYRAKALFAFEEVDGTDICFFGMHVQEYGSESPTPNRRRVYIAYLDSVHFFQPRQYRTAVYHEILLGYLDYAKQLGYTMAHIWACPPSEGDDYIFHCHPPEQKIPKPKRLQEWYKKMLDKGIIERIIQDYKDILKQAMEDNISSAAELPYFEGDFWPNVLEESIKELDQEEEEKRKQAEAAEAVSSEENEQGPDGKKKGQKKAKKSNKSKAAQRKNSKKQSDQQQGSDLSAKIFATMEKHKEVFFVIRLHSAQSAASLAPIQDPDTLLNCELMDGRDAFLTMARDRHYEFSSTRRARYSTLCMLYELHNQGTDKFVYTCNTCKAHVETRYHCTVCDDFDLCIVCYDKEGHPHKMEKLGLDIDVGASPGDMRQANPQEARKQSIQRCIQSLVHACQCRDANCRLPSCQKMKRVVTHTKNCKRRTTGDCPICKQLIALCCYHAKHCQETKCSVPFCSSIKQKMKHQQVQQRVQQQQLLRRRMAAMNTRMSCAAAPALASPPPSKPSAPPPPPPQHHTLNTNVQKALQQVQEEAARQQAPPYGKQAALVAPGAAAAPGGEWRYRPPPPLHHPHHHARPPPPQQLHQPPLQRALAPQQPPQQTNPQMHQKALQQLMATLRSPTSQNQQQEILQILKSNPPLMAAFIKQRQNAQNAQAGGGPGGVGGVGSVAGLPQQQQQQPLQHMMQQPPQQRLQHMQHKQGQQQVGVGGPGTLGPPHQLAGGGGGGGGWFKPGGGGGPAPALLNHMRPAYPASPGQQQQQQQPPPGVPRARYLPPGAGAVSPGPARAQTPAELLLLRQQHAAHAPQHAAHAPPPPPHAAHTAHPPPPQDEPLPPPMTPQDQLSKFVEQL